MSAMASAFSSFDPHRVPSPCFVIDEARLEQNLMLLAGLQRDAGARVLLALKAFSLFAVADQVMRHLSGVAASGLWEATLGREEFGGEVHVFSPAYTQDDMPAILDVADHVVFNSSGQWQRFRAQAQEASRKGRDLKFGLRINPEHSEAENPLYDPCAPCSRLGVTRDALDGVDLSGLSGLHFHTLCDQGFAPLAHTVDAVERGFGDLFGSVEWINFGGGHLITAADYDVDALVALIRDFRRKHGLAVYIEPGTAVALDAGVLVTEVIDIMHNRMPIAIVDASATCHMPDVIEAPYRPDILGQADEPHGHCYRLGGPTCLAGDVIGDYEFTEPLEIGRRLMIEDQAYYTMVKATTFNGVKLPSIALWNSRTDALKVIKSFGYSAFRDRLS